MASFDAIIHQWMHEAMSILVEELRDTGQSFVDGIDDDDEAKTLALTAEAELERPAGYIRMFVNILTEQHIMYYIGPKNEFKPEGSWIASRRAQWVPAKRPEITFTRTPLAGVYSFRINESTGYRNVKG